MLNFFHLKHFFPYFSKYLTLTHFLNTLHTFSANFFKMHFSSNNIQKLLITLVKYPEENKSQINSWSKIVRDERFIWLGIFFSECKSCIALDRLALPEKLGLWIMELYWKFYFSVFVLVDGPSNPEMPVLQREKWERKRARE